VWWSGAEVVPGAVRVDDAADEAVHERDEAVAPGPGALQVEAREPGEVVGPVELAQQVVAFVHEAPQLPRLGALLGRVQLQVVPPAEHRPHHVVQGPAAQDAADLEAGRGRRRRRQLLLHGGDHLARDDGALRGGGGDLPRGEEVRGRHAAERAPVGAVGREADGAVEQEPVRGLLDGTVRERRAVEDLPRHVRVRGHHHPRAAEGERHQAPGAEAVRRRRQLAVRQARHEPHAPDHGQAPRPRNGGRRDPPRLRRPPPPSPRRTSREAPVEEASDDEGHGADRQETGQAVRLVAAGAFGG